MHTHTHTHTLPCGELQVLEQPGSADLSAWVDFGALRQGAQESGAPVAVYGPVSQASFLTQLGIHARLEQLLQVGLGLLMLLPPPSWPFVLPPRSPAA